MAITQAIANNFKKLLLEGDSNFKQSGGDKYKLALYPILRMRFVATRTMTPFIITHCGNPPIIDTTPPTEIKIPK